LSRVLVTGARGFVGRLAVEALQRRGFEVHAAGRREADLLETSGASRLVRSAGASHLLHLAWTTEHGRYWEDPANRDWVAATARLIEAFVQAGGERVVLAGSCAQYDWSAGGPFSEGETPRRPATLYGRAKQEASELVPETGATAMLFFPYGPHEPPKRLVPSVARSILAGEEARTTAGTQVRDFIHVADCGAALAALLESEVAGDVNVGSGEGTAVAEVARTVARLAGREELLGIGALPDGGDETRVVASTERLRDEVGFVSSFTLEEGLRDAVEWWRQRTRRR
jgi:nucleoside-diphosphate-sugar epimerase